MGKLIQTIVISAFGLLAQQPEGNAESQYQLARKYASGDGVPKDGAESAKLYQASAGQFNIGQSYRRGFSVEKDDAEAVAWYRKSAEQGCLEAQFNLGVMYFNGWGIHKDPLQAYVWFNLPTAHAKGDQAMEFAVDRDWAAKKLSAAQLAEGQRLASEWKPKRAGE